MFRFSLLPKDDKFFDYFERAGDNLVEAAQTLEALLGDFGALETHLERLKKIERTGDEITREVMRALNRTFITPLDREDITELIHRLDDVVDKAWAGAVRLKLYAITEPDETARQLAGVLVRMTG